MEGHSLTHPDAGAETGGKGLKKNAIGFVDALIIGLASTAPAYSLAAVLGAVALEVDLQAPAVLLFSFAPMFLIAAAFFYMNRADPDCGTAFSWITRAMGPYVGWMAGWAICTTGILVIGSLADIAASSFYNIIGVDEPSKGVVTITAVALIAAMTALCVIGTEISARFQRTLIVFQVSILVVFAIVALIKVVGGDGAEGSVDPSLSWFNPFAVDGFEPFIIGLLTGVFIYWGWESAVNLNEEVENSNDAPGRAAVTSTVILLFTYVLVTVAVIAYAGAKTVGESEDESLFFDVAEGVFGTPLDKLVVFAILTSALASTQTTILPASRTTLSMARQDAMPEHFGRVHKRFLTPHFSTITIGVVAAVWYAFFNTVTQNFLFDSVTALAIMIAFYYSLTGFACAIYYRRELTKSVKSFLFIGVAPLVGGTILAYMFVRAIGYYSDPENADLSSTVLGLAMPAAIGIGLIILGAVLMLIWRLGGHAGFFGRRRETADPDVAAGRKQGTAAVPERAV